MDATMKRSKLGSLVGALVSIGMVPLLWTMAFGAIPALATVQADTSGGRLGPWVFTWALVWIATCACFAVAWLCYSSGEMATS